MAFTQSQLDALEAAIASGERAVQYNGKRVEYHSLAEMIRARDLMRAELAGAAVNRGGATLVEFDRTA